MRISSCGLLLLCLGVGGCSGGKADVPTGPSGPPSAGSAIVYSVVGASDVVGLGSSKVCAPFEDCDGNGYAWVAARAMRGRGFTVDVAQLGIPAAVLGPSTQALASTYGIGGIPANILSAETPFVRKDATFVTVFAGANDVNVITAALGNGAGSNDPAAFIDQQVGHVGTDFSAVISAIRNRAPAARIIVINMPNMGGVPFRAGSSLALKQATQRASVGITTRVINPMANVTVIDLMCDSRFYQSSTFSSDGFHPNDAGYAIMATEIVNAMTNASYPAPRASCSQMFLY